LMVSHSHCLLSSHADWKSTVLPRIIDMSHKKAKDYPSLTTRVVFKYMDILDTLD